MYNIILTKSVNKSIERLETSNPQIAKRITVFLKEVLSKIENPKNLKNATKLKGYDNKYRWRIGDYRIIGIIKDDILTIEIIKISTRQGAYK